LVLVAAMALIVSAAGSAKSEQEFTMAIVTDIGSLQDKGFNELANKGRLQAQKELGIKTRVYVTQKAEDRLPNLLAAANAGYSLVFGVGFFHAEHLNTVAPRYPDQMFSGIDVTKFLLEASPANYAGIVFAEHEAGYLVGYLAGLTVARQGGPQVISSVGANAVPAIVKYMSGYIQGAKAANKKIKVLSNYANDPTFSDQAKCKEVALRQLARGSQVVFAVAGGCGLGALSSAKEKGKWGIGVDADQGYLGKHMLTSAVKKVDVSVVVITKLAKAGKLKGNTDFVFNVKNKGVDYGRVSNKVPAADIAKLNAVKKNIASGKIKVKEKVPY
jgi:basic membrane protein A